MVICCCSLAGSEYCINKCLIKIKDYELTSQQLIEINSILLKDNYKGGIINEN